MVGIKPLLLCLCIVAGYASYAQKTDKVKYGKITPEEFQTKVTGVDSAASAVVLFDIGVGYFADSQNGIEFIMERHTRIKILNKDGYDYANLELQFYRSGSGRENTLLSMDGATYNMEGGQMTVSKIGKDAKFSERQDRNYTLKKFALPNVREGSVIEYKYKIKSDFIFTLKPWVFQRDIPTLFSEYSLTVPQFYWYRSYTNGFVNIHPQQERTNTGGTLWHYFAQDVPGLKDEKFVANMDDYRSRVAFELSSVTVPGVVYEDISSSWPKAIKSLKKAESFGQFVGKTGYSKSLVSSLVKDNADTAGTIRILFDHVKNNVKWNKETSFYVSAGNPRSVLEKKIGNSADVNLSLLTLLTEAGIEAYPILVSTRSNGAHPGFPMISGFDNVIVMAKSGQNYVLLDATDKNHVPGLIAYQNLNHQGMMVNLSTETGQWISLEDDKFSQRNISLTLKLDESNKLSGKAYISSVGYEGLKRRLEYQSAADQADFLKSFKADKPGLEIKSYEIANLDNPGEMLSETMDLELEGNVEEAGNLAFFTPLLFERTKENPLRLEERLFPVDFAYPAEENYRMTLEFPEHYIIEKTPKNEKVSLPDNKGYFAFLFVKEGNKLMVQSKISIGSSMFNSEEYHSLKELFMNVVRKQSEQVVFKKN